jgi:Tat protein secretion system quality control protein TatD with DNase activity
MYDADDFGGTASLQGNAKLSHYRSVLLPKQDQFSDEERHIFASLPDPKPFSQFLEQMRTRLENDPLALVGEIGLDRSFRIPIPESDSERDGGLTPGGREGKRLSPFRVDIKHQKKILLAQLRLAGELQRAVSVHGVQAHGIVFETLRETWSGHEKKVHSKRERKRQAEAAKTSTQQDGQDIGEEQDAAVKPFPPRICLHSYSGGPDAFKQYLNPSIPAEIYASFSTAINLSDKQDSSAPRALEELIRLIPDDRLLVESDLHIAGPRMDEHLEDMVRRLCKIKGWSLSDGVRQLGSNWQMFAFGRR